MKSGRLAQWPDGCKEPRFASGDNTTVVLSLAIAFVVRIPVIRWLIARGRGHAFVHNLLIRLGRKCSRRKAGEPWVAS